jgi:predicted metal-dependent hydrolase
MKTITVNNKTLIYEIKRISKKNIIIKVKGDFISVSTPKATPTKTVEKLLTERFDFLYEKTLEAKLNETVHFGGVAYRAVFVKGSKNGVRIEGDELIISATRDGEEYYRRVLYDFYKRQVEARLTQLIYDAQCDFPEIRFPKISVRYMKSKFGCYKRSDNTVKLSSVLAKRDFLFIKLTLYHELAHAIEFNHSKKFYELLERKLPGATALQKLLKSEKYNDIM